MRCLTCNGDAEALDYGDRWMVRCLDTTCCAHSGIVQKKKFMAPNPRVKQNQFWVNKRNREREVGFSQFLLCKAQ